MKMFGMEIPPKKKEEVKNEETEILNEQKDNLESTASPEMMAQANETVEKVTKLQSLIEKAKNMLKDEAETTKEGFAVIKQKLEEFAASKKVQNATEWTLIAATAYTSYKLFDNYATLFNEQVAVPGGNYAKHGVEISQSLEKIGSVFFGIITGITAVTGADSKIRS